MSRGHNKKTPFEVGRCHAQLVLNYEENVLEGSASGHRARKGLTAPVSLLLILFSLTLVSTVAYNYTLKQIDSRKLDLKTVAAIEKMLDLEEATTSSAWSPGSSNTLAFSDYGGKFRVEPGANALQVNITLGTISDTVFESNTGCFVYELPSITRGRVGTWLRGDQRSIVNQSTSYLAQVNIVASVEHQEIVARYRPLVSSSVGGISGGRRINNVRIYIFNLNSSGSIQSSGELHVKVTCLNITTSLNEYNGSTSDTVMKMRASLDGISREIQIPIEIGTSGSMVRVELVISNVEIQEVPV
jgi:hypothetical protein